VLGAQWGATAVIDYRLLGPIEAGVNGDALDIGGQKQRALLAILVLSANRPVSRDVLVDRLWGERPPVGAQHTLEVYVSRLRKALEPVAGGPVVLTRPGAYLLRAPSDHIDVCRFERLAREGRGALAAGAPGQAAADLRGALALWRGAPLADVGDEPFAQAEIGRLEELRAGVIEDRIEADLALGHHAHVVGELEALVAAQPLRERLCEQLMIALYRCGRQAEALAAYRSARRLLVEELGIEPGPGLKRVERAILEQDVSLEPPPRPPGPPAIDPEGPERPPPVAAAYRARLLTAAGAVLACILALLVGGSSGSRGSAASLVAGPDTVGIIDGGQGILSGVVTGAGRPGGVAYGAGATWISDAADDQLIRVDRAGRVVDRIPVGRGPGGVTVGDGQVWVANQSDGTISEVNPAAGTVVATIGVGNGPDAVTFGYRSVWVANATDATLSRIDPGSGHVLAAIPLGASPAGLAAGERGIWVTSPQSAQLLLVDPRTNRVSHDFPVGVSPGGVAVGAGSVWVSLPGGAVARVDPVTGRAQKIRVGGSPAGIAYAHGAVWVADSQGGSVSRINPRTGSVRSMYVGNEPTTLAAAGSNVLVTVLPSLASHRGGTLTLVAQLLPHDQTTDPAAAWMPPIWQMLSVTNDGLVGYRRTGGPAGDTLVPDLATALPTPVDGGRTYTFQLRPGIRYSNGTPVRPQDFRHAIERVFAINAGPASYYTGIIGASLCARTPGHCDLARGIVTNDKADTVTFHLTAPDPEFLYKLAFPFADAVPAGTPDRQIGPTQLPATGPYMTQSFVPQHRWVLVRNPEFHEWSSQAQPGGYPSRIILRLDIAPGPAVNAVERGSADVLLSPPPARIHELATRYPSQLHSGPLGATVGLALNTRVWPFSVLAARRALNYAIDRATLIQLVGGPQMARPTCQILPPALPGYQPYCPYTIKPSPSGAWTAPDLARAEQMVRASGTSGARVTVVTGAFGTPIPAQATGRYLVSVLDQLGYRASLQTISDWNAYGKRLYDSRQRTQIGWFSWYQDYPAPSDFIRPLLTCQSFIPASPGNLNAAEFCNHRIDAQVKRALTLQSSNPSSAGMLWARIDQEIADQAPWVPVYNPRSLIMLSARVGNYEFDPYLSVLIDQLWVH
jgi:ABC-type transport system substrate-binding protein/DNA-binding SARP family transcriptional activator/streptogramin lyase